MELSCSVKLFNALKFEYWQKPLKKSAGLKHAQAICCRAEILDDCDLGRFKCFLKELSPENPSKFFRLDWQISVR